MAAVEASAIDIYEPDGYVGGPPHEVFEHLRRTQPVFWQDMPDGTGYWAILKHADVVHVAREPTLFSASEGGIVLEDLDAARLAMMRNMLLAMDPPRHVEYRRPLAEPLQSPDHRFARAPYPDDVPDDHGPGGRAGRRRVRARRVRIIAVAGHR
jgi:hypothetical protein